LHNPYNDQIAALAEEGHKKYLSAGCNGCHGGGGGGGMCPPLTNDTWVYGPDDDVLFRLIALGSDGLTKAGYKRVKQEVVVGPMPPFGGIFKTSDDLWKVITYIRSVSPGSEKKPPLQ
jgi:mono/diheme cytochrome c family protein